MTIENFINDFLPDDENTIMFFDFENFDEVYKIFSEIRREKQGSFDKYFELCRCITLSAKYTSKEELLTYLHSTLSIFDPNEKVMRIVPVDSVLAVFLDRK